MKPTNIDERLLAMEAELLLYAKALTHEKTRAEDLLQETNLRILLKQGKYKEKSKFSNWARKIKKNSFLNDIEHEEKITIVEDYKCYYNDMTCAPCDVACETGEIYHAVDHLPDGYGKMIRLLIMGHRYDEIAMMLGLPLGTVKSRIFASRKILKKELKDYME